MGVVTGEKNIQNWYALKVFFNKVFEIEKLLNEAQVESYVPCKCVVRESRGVKIKVRKPVIPSLMFFRSTEEYAVKLQSVLMNRVIVYSNLECRSKRKPAPIPDEEMKAFILVTESGDDGLEYFPDDYMAYKDGEHVRVVDGMFKGAEGVIKRIKHNRRLTVTLEGVCMVATSFIDPKYLEKIQD